ncbi:hypothetical protein HMPREF3156_02214 [Neisseria sp. HMSC06F02]|nr:hypothetical protein HMPREF3156_02214 [Neisseria sp. HMSC06F02]
MCSLHYVCLKSVARALPANNRESFSSFLLIIFSSFTHHLGGQSPRYDFNSKPQVSYLRFFICQRSSEIVIVRFQTTCFVFITLCTLCLFKTRSVGFACE